MLERELAGMERQFYQQNQSGSSNFCAVIFLEGSLDPSLFPKALAHLLAFYPALASRILASPKLRFSQGSPDALLPFVVVQRGDSEHWRRIAEQEIRRKYDTERIAVTLLRGEHASEILISMDHTFADGQSGYSVCHSFLTFLRGEKPAAVSVSGKAMESRFPTSFQGIRGAIHAILLVRRLLKTAPARSIALGMGPDTIHTATAGLSFDAAFLERFKAASKKHKSNLNAAICAAALLDAVELFSDESSGFVALNTPVSLRAQLNPIAPVEELGLFISGFLQWQAIESATCVWNLAERIKTNLQKGVEAKEPMLMAHLMRGPKVSRKPRSSKRSMRFAPTLNVTNPGLLPELPAPTGTRITGYRNLVSLWPHDAITLVIIGYGGQLLIDVQVSKEKFNHVQNPAQRLADKLQTTLRKLVEP